MLIGSGYLIYAALEHHLFISGELGLRYPLLIIVTN